MSLTSIKNTKGFCTIQTLLLIGIFATLIFSFGFLSFLAQAKMQFRTTCLSKSIALQKEIIRSEKALFALNPLSTALQMKYDITTIQLAAAVASYNYPAVIKLTAELEKTYLDQVKLDRLQKTLITGTKFAIAAGLMQTIFSIEKDANQLSLLWNPFLNILFHVQVDNNTQMSVKAVSAGLAPNYELKDNYKQEQKVAFIWQMKYSPRLEKQKLVTGENKFEMSCQAIPNQSEGKWSVEI